MIDGLNMIQYILIRLGSKLRRLWKVSFFFGLDSLLIDCGSFRVPTKALVSRYGLLSGGLCGGMLGWSGQDGGGAWGVVLCAAVYMCMSVCHLNSVIWSYYVKLATW